MRPPKSVSFTLTANNIGTGQTDRQTDKQMEVRDWEGWCGYIPVD